MFIVSSSDGSVRKVGSMLGDSGCAASAGSDRGVPIQGTVIEFALGPLRGLGRRLGRRLWLNRCVLGGGLLRPPAALGGGPE